MPHIVGIFDSEWACETVIHTEQADLPVEYTTAEHPVVAQLLEQLRTRAAESLQPQKDESGCITGYVTRLPGEVGYAQAVADECKRVGLRSAVLDADLLPMLQQVPRDARPQVLPEVLYMEHDLAVEVLRRVTA